MVEHQSGNLKVWGSTPDEDSKFFSVPCSWWNQKKLLSLKDFVVYCNSSKPISHGFWVIIQIMIFALWFPVKVSKVGFPSQCVLWIKIYIKVKWYQTSICRLIRVLYLWNKGTLLKSDWYSFSLNHNFYNQLFLSSQVWHLAVIIFYHMVWLSGLE